MQPVRGRVGLKRQRAVLDRDRGLHSLAGAKFLFMSRAKTVCLTFRDFLNGPVHFQVPEGYKRLQLNHFSATWSYDLVKLALDRQRDIMILGMLGELIASYVRDEEGELKHIAPPITANNPDMLTGYTKGLGLEDDYWRVNPYEIDVPHVSDYIQAPGMGLYKPWIDTDPFEVGNTTLKQKTTLQLPYTDVIPNYIQLSCTGLGAWNDIISVCTYPGNAPNLGMQGNTYEILNPSLTFTVLTDTFKAVNNVTLTVQFTLL